MIRIVPVVGPDDGEVGLPVVDGDGQVVGTVSDADADHLRVTVSADAPEDALRSLDWSADDAERVLPAGRVAERTGDAVRISA